jgi:DNA-binding NarL/FixJ family response regulator
MDDLRLLIIGPDALSRAGLAMLLSQQAGLAIVGQISAEADLSSNLAVYQPEVILWDLGWEAETAISTLAELGESTGPIVALLADESQAGEVWRLGVPGLLLRNGGPELLAAAVRAVAQGLVVLDPALVDIVGPRAYGEAEPLVEALTAREVEVLQLLAEGLANKAIARRLNISDHTVKFHVNAILSKLGAQSRTEAVVRATRLGLILL